MATDRRFIAFYLPQYHRIPENDRWWGDGFTEWTNVRRTSPRFPGHYQPHVPDDLGYYDLTDSETRERQARLAQEYGVDGFCYYHYWFHGRRLLERPFNEVLSTHAPDIPFSLCWANEHWTRAWDGRNEERLMGQSYCIDDDARHIKWLAQAFLDERYIRIDGKPLLLVYRVHDLPHPAETAELWRSEAQRLGVGDLYLCQLEAYPQDRGDPRTHGFDASVEFQPDFDRLGPRLAQSAPRRAVRRLLWPESGLRTDRIYDYRRFVELALDQADRPYKRYRCVTPGWDNSPRREREAVVLHGSTPEDYERFLRGVLAESQPYSADENLVFVNAWNEWGEGNHLEPDQRWGRAYLEAHLRATGRVSAPR